MPDCSSAERSDWMPRDPLKDAFGGDGATAAPTEHHQRVYLASTLAVLVAALLAVALLAH